MQIGYNSLLLSALFLLVSAKAIYPQSPVYAKFDSKSSTIGLYNLLPDTTGCEGSRVFSGKISKVRREAVDSLNAYNFTLDTSPRLQFHFGISTAEIPQKDVDGLIAKNRRVRVRARLCGSAGIWTAEEIKRL
jgi:hypothetical protein